MCLNIKQAARVRALLILDAVVFLLPSEVTQYHSFRLLKQSARSGQKHVC